MIWWKNEEPLPLNNLAMKDSMVGWGRNPHEQKKDSLLPWRQQVSMLRNGLLFMMA